MAATQPPPMFWVICIPEFIAVGFCLFRDAKFRLGIFTQGCSSTLSEVNSPMGFTTPNTARVRTLKKAFWAAHFPGMGIWKADIWSQLGLIQYVKEQHMKHKYFGAAEMC